MEEGVGSGGVVKKKSSSGCLIIKKKVDGIGGGIGSSSSSRKEKKRHRMVVSDSGSSDEFSETPRRKMDKFRKGSVVYRKGINSDARNGEREIERKRSRLDLYEFDEYDEFDGKRMRNANEYMDDRLNLMGRSANQGEFVGALSRNSMVDKRRHSYLDKGVVHYNRNKFQEASDEPIRLQGKNGVLKVMVNKKKKPGLSNEAYDHHEAVDRKGYRSAEAVQKSVTVGPSFYSDSKPPVKPITYSRREKNETIIRKQFITKSSKNGDSGKDDGDNYTLPKLELGSSTEGVKIGRKSESINPISSKEGKINRGSGTEKQMLREKIRSMLINSGWTIDYRPRRNRDYHDAVYINPSGTAYWSIVKAYDAFQKQLEEDDCSKRGGDSSAVALLPDEMLRKLTRQTRKKIEKEMKKKKRDDVGNKKLKNGDMRRTEENHKSLKGRAHEDDSNDDNSEEMERQDGDERSFDSRVVQGRKSRKIGRCTLLVRGSDKGQNLETDDYVPYTGKRTLLSWLIDSGVVKPSQKVQYMNRKKTRVMLEGWITKEGIHCGCCSKILSVSKFELHAGTKQRQPFQNIVLESGISLLQCQVDAWNRQEESERRGFHSIDIDGDDPNDDTCGVCGDGGDLICCDGCPSTFHQSCLDIKMLPPGDWHCPNCACKFCGIASEGRRTAATLLSCSLCDKKYHESCTDEINDLPADSSTASTTFCGQKCQELFEQLQRLLGVKHELEAGFSWSLIHRMDPGSDTSSRGCPQRVESNSKLAVALSIMDECFLPIFDRRSGINLMHNVLYNCGSNFNRLNYSGFYTAILERGDEIISAASIRIHGLQLAEMPFIGTRPIYRRQGMCRRLLFAIESTLSSLKVEQLIIPSIAEHLHTWTVVFGFNPLEETNKQEMKSVNMLVFPGTDMLHKRLVKQEISEQNRVANSDTESVELKNRDILVADSAKKSKIDSSDKPDHEVADDNTVRADSSDASPQPVIVSCKNKASIKSQANDLSESITNVTIPSPSGATTVRPEVGRSILHSPVKDHMNVKAHSVDETFTMADVGENQNQSQLDSDVKATNLGSISKEKEMNLASIVSSDAEISPNVRSTVDIYGVEACEVIGNGDSNQSSLLDEENQIYASSKVAQVEGEIENKHEDSFYENAEKDSSVLSMATEICSKTPVSSLTLDHTTHDLNPQSAVEAESNLVMGVESVPGTKIASFESSFGSSASADMDDNLEPNVVKASCSEPTLDSSGNTYATKSAERLNKNENRVSVSTSHSFDALQLNQSEELVASTVISDETAPSERNSQSNGTILVEVSCPEPALDSLGNTFATKAAAEAMNADQNPVSVSASQGTVISDEIAPICRNVQSNGIVLVETLAESGIETSYKDVTE